MRKKLILCSSITYALKGRKLLSGKGYKVYIVRPPLTYSGCGCGYCISVNSNDAKSAYDLLVENGVRIKSVFDYDDEDD